MPNSIAVPRCFLFKVAPECNEGKLSTLDIVHSEWSRTVTEAYTWYWAPFIKGGLLPKKPVCSGSRSTFPTTKLVTSQKDLIVVAIEGQAKSWASNLKNRISAALMRDRVLDSYPTLRRQMLWINSMRAWLLPYPAQLKLLAAQPQKNDTLTELSALASRTARKIVRKYIQTHRLPDPNQIHLQVNVNSGVFSKASKSKVSWADSWLSIATLERGKRLVLPLLRNQYADERGGRRASTYSLIKKDSGWFVIATQYVEPKPWASHQIDVLGIDLGLKTLLATSEGDLYGQGFMKQLCRYDVQLQRLQKGLQQAGEYRLANNRRYRNCVSKIRGWIKTTVQTNLKRLLETRQPKKVVIEDLLFTGRHGELSRRMNRLLHKFGQQFFVKTLEERSEEFGFEIEKVAPAYSSQTCNACGFVHRDNRKGDVFKCLSCNHHAHADVNAAKNHARRSWPKASSAAGVLYNQWVRSVSHWMERLRSILVRASSGLSGKSCAVGCARAGLLALAERKSSAIRLSSDSKLAFIAAAKSDCVEGLLKGLSVQLLLPNRVTAVSTRFSG